ncbi:autotransporter domain-containing protein [Cereibacter changlensis]|nr:autotransporter domain-containing protein [Cereibacter changlensis]PZX48755.1 outer membrane autotransporter protein [Cereibacter changlensis]
MAGAAGAALVAGGTAVVAETAVWNSGGGSNKLWDSGANWQLGSAPSATSTATIDGGAVKNAAVRTAVTGAAVAGSLDIGRDGAAAKATLVQTTGAGTLTVGALHLKAGSWLQILNSTLAADIAALTTGALVIDDKAILDISAGNIVAVASELTLAGTAQGAGTLMAGSITQTDGRIGAEHVVTDSYVMSGGKTATTTVSFASSFLLSGTGAVSDVGATLTGGEGSIMDQTGGSMGGNVSGIDSYSQSAGVMGVVSDGFMNGKVTTATYSLSGGSLYGAAEVSSLFALSGSGSVEAGALLTGGAGSAMTQSGGTMAGSLAGAGSYAQSAGLLSGSVATGVYALTSASASSTGGHITASDRFDLALDEGETLVEAKLSGGGGLNKSGAGTAVLANGANDFGGAVTIEAGTLAVIDDALPDYASVSVAEGATLLMNIGIDTLFMGAVVGLEGELVKQGGATLTLGGDVSMGGLQVIDGKVQIGTGLTENTVSFDYAIVDAGATLHVASGATLTIRVPNNLVNNGVFINDGTVNDDLDNTGQFDNNEIYNANVLSNTSSISNNAPGLWTGDILGNDGEIDNASGAEWVGDVEGNAGTVSNSGDWVGDVAANGATVSNAKGATWTGRVGANSGTVYNRGDWVGSVGTNDYAINNIGGVWAGDIETNDSQIANTEDGVWNGDILGNANAIFNYSGATWNGDVVANGDVDTWAPIDNRAQWNGDIKSNAGGILNNGGTWDGDVEANAGDVANLAGSWTGDVLANAGSVTNEATWSGDVLGNAGLISNDGDWAGDVLANAGSIVTSGVWDGDFTSAGLVAAEGQINGAFTNSGALHVTGGLSGITTLASTGILSLQGGGAAQTLTVGALSFGAGSSLRLDVDAAGGADRLVAGTATLAGGVSLFASSTGGAYSRDTVYEILTADSITGTFDTVKTDLAFLAAQLDYDETAVSLTLKRNDIGFAETGRTANQRAAAAGAESLGAGNAIYDAVLWLGEEQVGQAFDQLSGEAYASFETVSLRSAVILADLVTAHLDSSFGPTGGSPVASRGPAGPSRAAGVSDASVWARIYGGSASLGGDGDTADVDATTGGFAAGIDSQVGDWRLGAMLHAGQTNADADDRATAGESTDYGLGLYGGRQWGATSLMLGATYTRHDWEIDRRVAMSGFADGLSADYASDTSQIFAKVSHDFAVGDLSLSPYASLAYVHQSAGSFDETGGAAALSSGSASMNAIFTTLGLNVSRAFIVEGMRLTTKGGIGWRHAEADSSGSMRRLAGGDAFYIVGAGVPSDMAVLSAGFDLELGADNTIGLVYDGQIGEHGAESHMLNVSWNMRF